MATAKDKPHGVKTVAVLGAGTIGASWCAPFLAAGFKVTVYDPSPDGAAFVRDNVATRLQAALWREAIHLVAEGVASVADVDKAVTAGPGLRWSVMGPYMLFSLGTPTLTEDVGKALAAGIRAEEAGRDFQALATGRGQFAGL